MKNAYLILREILGICQELWGWRILGSQGFMDYLNHLDPYFLNLTLDLGIETVLVDLSNNLD